MTAWALTSKPLCLFYLLPSLTEQTKVVQQILSNLPRLDCVLQTNTDIQKYMYVRTCILSGP